MATEMQPLYDPSGVETRWQETWEAEGLYAAHADNPRPSFVDAHPPPTLRIRHRHDAHLVAARRRGRGVAALSVCASG